jgi:hypothetical protein
MWGMVVGEWYFVQSPQFFFLGRVREANAAGVKFEPGGEQIHQLNDLATFLETGKHANGDEFLPVPMAAGMGGLLLSQSTIFDWPHGKPSGKRSHARAAAE